MNRDISLALWNRRIGRRCFAAQQSIETGDRRVPSASSAPAESDTSELAVPSGWRTLVNDRQGWTIEAAADRL
jgi:hypothetical protein